MDLKGGLVIQTHFVTERESRDEHGIVQETAIALAKPEV